MLNKNSPELKPYWHNECLAPKLINNGCNWRFFYKKIANYPNDCKVEKGWMRNDYDWARLLNEYNHYQDDYNRGKNIVGCSCLTSKGIQGYRKIDFTISSQPQSCSNKLLNDLEELTNIEFRGKKHRVKVHNNERYIIFSKNYNVQNYTQEAEKILLGDYLFDGVFNVVDRKHKYFYRAQLSCKDYTSLGAIARYTSILNNQIKNSKMKNSIKLGNSNSVLAGLYRCYYIATTP